MPATLSAPSARLLSTLSLLSDGVRLRILARFQEGEVNVTDLCAAIGMSQPAVSHHLSLLRTSGLAEARRDGKHNFYSLTERGAFVMAAIQAIDEAA